MNKHVTHSLKFFLLLVLALSSACGPVTAIPSPTLTPAPSQSPTVTPNPTNTPEPIHPQGTLVYLASGNITTVNLQNQEIKTISIPETSYKLLYHSMVIGDKIYIANNSDESLHRSEIIEISPDGATVNQLLPLTNKYWPLYCGKISPDRRYLLCYYEGWKSILVIDIETKLTQTVSAEGDRSFQSISWSPNSKKLYLLEVVNVHTINGVPVAGTHEKGRLLEFSFETNKLSELLPEISNPDIRWGYQDQIAGWSPDGINLLINLACNSNSTDTIEHPYIFNADDRTNTPIKIDGCISRFEWSPDGAKIALTMFDKNSHSDLFIYDTASQNLQKIPVNDQQVFSFAWSPTQKYILFSVWTFQDNRNGVYLLNVSDGSVIQVMPNAKYSYSYQADDFIWSPNGDVVLFGQGAQGNGWEFYLLNAETKTVEFIERQVGNPWFFNQIWSPDGRFFIYVGGHPTRTIKIQSAYSGEQIEIKVPNENVPSNDIYWIVNNSLYYSGVEGIK